MESLPSYQENLPAGQNPSADIQLDWMFNAETAASRTEALSILTAVANIETVDLQTDLRIHHLLRRLQKEDPHLTYIAENSLAYQILTKEEICLEVKKNRQNVKHVSENWSPLLRLSYLGFGLAVMGLSLAGLGTLVFAPLTCIAALAANLTTHSREVRSHSLVLVMLSGGVWLLGLLFSVIFLFHLL